MTTPLRISFDVACPAEHAFRTWTAGIGTWWPPDHTVSGRPADVVLQSGVGGRIYERAADGTDITHRGRFGMYLPPLLEALGLAELTHDARNNQMRAV
ncbi:MAG TPA: hypothetical protein VGS06_31100 [Streptosporangiaceae bacterium]|nr:hypothetical protein [Streptosporangiaceae bacterium]